VRAPAARALRALIFDFDHTLTDFGHWVDWRAARARIGELYTAVGIDVEDEIRRRGGFSVFTALDAALAARTSRARADEVHAAALAILEEHEGAGAERASLLAGVASTLRDAAGQGLALAIVSANGERPIRATLARLGVERVFTAVVGRTMERPPKPEPAMHREALRLLGCPAEAALAIGDSPNDMRAAAAAGILTVGVMGGEGDADQLFATGAAWVLADLTALPTLLAAWRLAAAD
jgi:phosphoglycolate phosphatase